jgi:myosin protein heavy chain
LDAARNELESEGKKRRQLEKSVSNQKTELARHRDTIAKLQLELNKALEDLKAREQTVKYLEGRQNKTIVEHVHVLEEAKRVTDRQLADAQAEIKKNTAYIRSLEKVKSRLTGEAEDLERLWTREKTGRLQEEKAARALADLEKEKQAKEMAELQCRKLRNELQDSQRQVLELNEELTITQTSKSILETELAELADDLDASNPLGELQRTYEKKITELQGQLDNGDMVRVSVGRIKEHVDRHHEEIRRLIINGLADDNFRSRLLLELQSSDDYLAKEFTRPRGRNADDRRSLPAVHPTKRHFDSEVVPQNRKAKSPATFDRQVSALKQHVQVLEVQIAASDRVRRHLEATIKNIMIDLENSDGSKQSLQEYRTRLSKENAKLAELLEQEAQARHAAEVAQISGVQEMWNKFQTTISDERESYSKLEESRKALVGDSTCIICSLFESGVAYSTAD